MPTESTGLTPFFDERVYGTYGISVNQTAQVNAAVAQDSNAIIRKCSVNDVYDAGSGD